MSQLFRQFALGNIRAYTHGVPLTRPYSSYLHVLAEPPDFAICPAAPEFLVVTSPRSKLPNSVCIRCNSIFGETAADPCLKVRLALFALNWEIALRSIFGCHGD